MTARPILFSAPMVRALLDGTKTQTRRVLNAKSHVTAAHRVARVGDDWLACEFDRRWPLRLPYAIGDRLWVREAYHQRGHWEPVEGKLTKGGAQKWAFVPVDDVILFEAPESFRSARHRDDPATVDWHKRLGRFMPRKYSRLTLTVTDVRVERLQDISEDDAYAEGIESEIWDMAPVARDYSHPDAHFIGWPDAAIAPSTSVEAERVGRESYRTLWNSINGPDAWCANPWVVAASFDVHQCNIDQMGAQ